MADIEVHAASQKSDQYGIPQRCYWHNGHSNDAAHGQHEGHSTADIIVIGGGFAGLATACRIAELRPEKKILLLEAKVVGYGASGRNGGLVSPLAAPIWLAGALGNSRQSDALRMLYTKSHEAAQWAKLHAPDAEVEASELQITAQGALTSAGLNEVAEVIGKSGLSYELGKTPNGSCELRLPCHTIHPYQLALGLADYALRLGIQILEYAPVQSIQSSKHGAAVTLSDGSIMSSERVVVSTNAYSNSISAGRQPPAKVVRNFMLATAPLSEAQKASLLGNDKFIVELNSKYIFYRIHADRLIFGGIDKIGTSTSENDFEIPDAVSLALRRALSMRVKCERDIAIDYSWGGRFHLTSTDLPVIKECTDNPSVVYNIGYGGTGVALTLALAPVAAALTLKQKLPDEDAAFIYQVMRETRLPIISGIKLAGLVSRRLLRQAFSIRA
ncbi:MAG: hypothetical protein CTY31_13230 [Hyphomicrobium sp.]|nr:MAG: hypothetical protein CTY31_13230 [Hyphomicrobium sp.]